MAGVDLNNPNNLVGLGLPVVDFWLPFHPPSANKVYTFNWAIKRVVLSDEARKFKADLRKHVTDTVLRRTMLSTDPLIKINVPYQVDLTFLLPTLVNKGWPKTKAKYKRKDLSNWLKLFEDSLKDIFGYDDSQNVRIILNKVCGDAIGALIRIYELDPAEVDKVFVLPERYITNADR